MCQNEGRDEGNDVKLLHTHILPKVGSIVKTPFDNIII
jgi:diadenosine tetraphosphate (Ap4A) HIT family hydrolase